MSLVSALNRTLNACFALRYSWYSIESPEIIKPTSWIIFTCMCMNILFGLQVPSNLRATRFGSRRYFVNSENRKSSAGGQVLVHPRVTYFEANEYLLGYKITISHMNLNGQETSSSPLSPHLPSPMTNFPAKLHYLLGEMERDGQSDIMSWQSNGKSFVVHNKARLEETILPQ